MNSWLRRVEVAGDSMRPTLEPGDRLLVVPWPWLRVGQLVAVPDPRQPDRVVVKRIGSVDSNGVSILGDNAAASTDSRTFGPVPRTSILGRAIYRYAPTSRAGRLH
jgi:nickel-type superoxide dismutase maturation protease